MSVSSELPPGPSGVADLSGVAPARAVAVVGAGDSGRTGAPVILLLQSDHKLRGATRRALEGGRWKVWEAESAEAGMEALGKVVPDVLVIDLDMPGLDGLAVLESVRAIRDLWWVPVIVLSERWTPEDISRALQAGANDYVAKPVSPTELNARVTAAYRVSAEGRRLVESERELRLIAEHMNDVVVRYDERGVVRYISPSGRTVLGWDSGDVVGRRVQELFHSEPGETVPGPAMPSPGLAQTTLRKVRRSDGPWLWMETIAKTVPAARGDGWEVQTVARDVTDRVVASEALVDSERRFRMGFDQCSIGMITWDVGDRVTRVNPAFCELLELEEDELVDSQSDSLVHPDDLGVRSDQIGSLLRGEGESYRTERRFIRADGSVVWGLVDTTAIRDESGRVAYFFSQVQDITERKSTEIALRYQAHHDPLTGLPNRYAMEHRLDAALERARSDRTKVAVLSVGVDRFKLVNDRLGHAAGDQVLVAVARRLALLAAPHPVARVSADWFVVVCETVADQAEAERLARGILALSEETVEVGGMQLHVEVSCGLALSDGSQTAGEVIRDADTAMSRAKSLGRGRVECFDEELRRMVTARFDVEHQLRRAIDGGELRVLYQPIVRLSDRSLVGVEALVRWEHPTLGLLPPAEFIPVAEDSGLIVVLGERVMEEALRQAVDWRGRLPGYEKLWTSVNISARQLSPGDPVSLCMRALAATSAPVDSLHLEVTETAVMTDVESSIRQLHALSDLGVAVTVDDFGTGYSSLAYLSSLPVDLLKIDRSFVAGLGRDTRAAKIVRAITTLSAELQIELCAEGVETESQLAAVRELGCDLAQGYLMAEPLTAEQLEARVSQPSPFG